ncbi:hypothetical protein BSKO_01292 [Bryopsis sp. KO-2023]|nr:hypothetical protein BSKO_01292 [Bryopsis sp. KO-2023]
MEISGYRSVGFPSVGRLGVGSSRLCSNRAIGAFRGNRPKRGVPVRTAATAVATEERNTGPGLKESYWTWKGHQVRYQQSGSAGPCVVLVHGFGGNCDHWRKNTPALGSQFRVYSLDLLGYGYSDKPDPKSEPQNSIYNFEEWGRQILDFIEGIVGEPSFLICNSIGGIAGLQAGITDSDLVRGVQLQNVSLRKLHVDNQPAPARPLIKSFQNVLYNSSVGEWFFGQVAKSESVKSILKQAYCDPDTVTDELVDVILKPGFEPGAAAVFLAFICNSEGPLPDELLEAIDVPVSILWGQGDPWEKVEWGREFEQYSSVEEFVELPGVGHCPHDEAPHIVNPLIERFVIRHSS